MSTKVLRCPWCRTTNLASKLAARGDRCRQCGNRVTWGLTYLREQAAKLRAAKTKKAKAAVRAAERRRPEWQRAQRQKRLGRAYHRADLNIVAAWERVVLTANEHDYRGVVAATRALARAERAKQQALRAMQRLDSTTPEATEARVVILQKED